MNVAVISFDQELSHKIKNNLSDYNVQLYIDSLSMLKDAESFNPDIIVYDASAGDFAVDDLKFLLTRDKLENKNFKILVSNENPVDKNDLPENISIDFYTKGEEDLKLIEDIKNSIEASKPEETPTEDFYQPPSDLESLLGDFGSGTEQKFEEEPVPIEENTNFDSIMEEFPQVEESPQEIEEIQEINLDENIPESIEEVIPDTEIFEEPVNIPSKEAVSETEKNPQSNNIRLEIEISPEELKRMIIELTVEKLVNDLKNDDAIQKLISDLQKDFIDKTEKELDDLKENLKKEIKENLVSKIETDLKETIKETIREDVTKVTSEIVKEKLEQLFGKK
ncbi:hypothetical protein [Persephonella sp.]